MRRLLAFGLCLVVLSAMQAQTLTLDSCVALALRNNLEVRTSQLEVMKAQEVKKQAFTKYFPQFQIGALGYYAAQPLIRFGIDDIESNDMRELLQAIYESVSTETDLKNELTLMKRGMSVTGTMVQPIYAGGRIVTGNRLASMGVKAAELMGKAKTRDVVENIESSYFLVTGLQQKVATLEAALALIDSLDRMVQAALANGLVTNADALQLTLKRNEMLANQQQLTSGIRLSKRLLCQQIGVEYSDAIAFEDASDEMPSPIDYSFSAVADSMRPEMELLKLNVEAERLKKRMTIGEQLPQLAFMGTAFYGNMIRKEPSANAIAILTLTIPVTGWWENAHKIRAHNIAIDEALIMQDNYAKMMSLEEEKAYSDMMDAWMLMKSDKSSLELAKENYRLANLNYSAGNATISDVLQAHALLLQAENTISDRQTTYRVARRRLQDLRNNE